jgi:hypothetical protein
MESRDMQWSALTVGKKKNQLAQTEFRFIKTKLIIRVGNYTLFLARMQEGFLIK